MANLQQNLNNGNLNNLGTMCQLAKMGDEIASLPVRIFRGVPTVFGASDVYPSTSVVLVLPQAQKAMVSASGGVLRCEVLAGAVKGLFGQIASENGQLSSSGNVEVSPAGDLIFLIADAPTSVEVCYVPDKYDLSVPYTLSAAPAATSIPLPAALTKLLVTGLASVFVNTGTTLGKYNIGLTGTATGSLASGQACLNQAKTALTVKAADSVQNVTIVCKVANASDLQVQLAADFGLGN